MGVRPYDAAYERRKKWGPLADTSSNGALRTSRLLGAAGEDVGSGLGDCGGLVLWFWILLLCKVSTYLLWDTMVVYSVALHSMRAGPGNSSGMAK